MKREKGAILTALLFGIVLTSVNAKPLFTRYANPKDAATLRQMIGEAREEFELIDVRTPAEYARGHISTATNIDYREIGEALATGDRERPIILYCRSGRRSALAERELRSIGYEHIVNFGGVIDWPYHLEQRK